MSTLSTTLWSSGSGLAFGYFSATLIESLFHQKVSDAPAKTVKIWKRWPFIFGPLIRANYSHHIIHHSKTYKKNHVTQFRSENEKLQLDQELANIGRHGEVIRHADYAIKLGGSGAVSFIVPFIPLSLLSYFLVDVAFSIAFSFVSALPAVLSHYVHPYLHMRRDLALKEVPVYFRWFVKTRYFNRIAQYHYIHHRRVACNYNLLLGGDFLRELLRRFLLRDTEPKRKICRHATRDEVEDMQKIGLIP